MGGRLRRCEYIRDGYRLGHVPRLYAAIIHGDSTAFSIGGTSGLWQAATVEGQHTRGTGLSGSHNSMECDGSPISSDSFAKQSRFTARVEHMQQLFGLHQHSKEGHERIPHNWYSRSRKTPYNNHFLLNDVIHQASHHPQFFRLGGNVAGKVKQFRPIDIKAMTSGVYRAATLHEDWNFAFVTCSFLNKSQRLLTPSISCVGYQAALRTAHDILEQHYHDSATPMKQLYAATLPILNQMSCPQWSELMDLEMFEWYPGWVMQAKKNKLVGSKRKDE